MKALVECCPICGSAAGDIFLQRQQVPVHQNLVVRDQEAALEVASGDLVMTVCSACGFIYNQAFDLSKLAYGKDYDNTQESSPYFAAYLDELIQHLLAAQRVQKLRIVEVGCGKGYFLKKLLAAAGSQSVGYGFDPSYQGPDQELGGRLQFRRSYYGPEVADIAADVVICRHVIEHVPEPLQLLQSIRQALKKSPDPHVFFETPDVEWILQNRVIWDFFYEHCSLFNRDTMAAALETAGFRVKASRAVFNGQYLWIEASLGSCRSRPRLDCRRMLSLTQEYGRSEQELIKTWRARLSQLAGQGRVALWGAGAKGTTFANLLDPDRRLIDCLVDLNPNKQGHFVPGTGHPIVNYRELAIRGITDAILMNPNYLEENQAIVENAGLKVHLLTF